MQAAQIPGGTVGGANLDLVQARPPARYGLRRNHAMARTKRGRRLTKA
jgi:hypothetical protein